MHHCLCPSDDLCQYLLYHNYGQESSSGLNRPFQLCGSGPHLRAEVLISTLTLTISFLPALEQFHTNRSPGRANRSISLHSCALGHEALLVTYCMSNSPPQMVTSQVQILLPGCFAHHARPALGWSILPCFCEAPMLGNWPHRAPSNVHRQ